MKFWEAGNLNYNPIFLAAHGFFPRSIKYPGVHFISVSFNALALALWLAGAANKAVQHLFLQERDEKVQISLTLIWIPMTDI